MRLDDTPDDAEASRLAHFKSFYECSQEIGCDCTCCGEPIRYIPFGRWGCVNCERVLSVCIDRLDRHQQTDLIIVDEGVWRSMILSLLSYEKQGRTCRKHAQVGK